MPTPRNVAPSGLWTGIFPSSQRVPISLNYESVESIPFTSKRPALPRGTTTSLQKEHAVDPDPTMTMGVTRVGAGETAATTLLRANHGAGWHTRQDVEVGHLADDGRIVNILTTTRTQSVDGMHRMGRRLVPVRVVDAAVS